MASPTSRKPAEVGIKRSEIETPALILDMDQFEANLATMSELLKPHPHVRLRPHAKAHKCSEIARIQLEHGAVGFCCQKVSEVAPLVRSGVEDILVTNEIVSPKKVNELCELILAHGCKLSILADSAYTIELYNKVAAHQQVKLTVLLEVNVGQNRGGIEIPNGNPSLSPLVALAQSIVSSSNLHFGGLHCYQGALQHVRNPAEMAEKVAAVCALTKKCVDELKLHSIPCEIVTGGGTGTFLLEASHHVHNECQAGSYIFNDVDYGKNLISKDKYFTTFANSLFLLTTVQSLPLPHRAVLDSGLKASSIDSGLPEVAIYHPLSDSPETRYTRMSNVLVRNGGDEHTIIETPHPPGVGSHVYLVPGHCDPTVNMHDWIVCVRGDQVVHVWPIDGRGPGY